MTHQAQKPVKHSRFSTRVLMLVTALIAVVLACCSGVVRYGERRSAEAARIDELNHQTKAAIVKEVEEITAELGRAPIDQVELEKLLGKSMPVFVHEYGESPIEYRQTDANSFVLHYFFWDSWYYDSKSPTSGWICVDW